MTIFEQPLTWFSIPVADMSRAVSFYNAVFGLGLEAVEYQGQSMAFFPMAEGQPGGALVLDPERAAGSGVLPYLNGGDDLNHLLQNISGAGGSLTTPKTDIGQGWGFFAHFKDSEGNEIGIWSPR